MTRIFPSPLPCLSARAPHLNRFFTLNWTCATRSPKSKTPASQPPFQRRRSLRFALGARSPNRLVAVARGRGLHLRSGLAVRRCFHPRRGHQPLLGAFVDQPPHLHFRRQPAQGERLGRRQLQQRQRHPQLLRLDDLARHAHRHDLVGCKSVIPLCVSRGTRLPSADETERFVLTKTSIADSTDADYHPESQEVQRWIFEAPQGLRCGTNSRGT